ncbi:predicted protein [Postia placenta Mad-698-R]|nr:predicted protein [Postia placenta Mad-698-R]
MCRRSGACARRTWEHGSSGTADQRGTAGQHDTTWVQAEEQLRVSTQAQPDVCKITHPLNGSKLVYGYGGVAHLLRCKVLLAHRSSLPAYSTESPRGDWQSRPAGTTHLNAAATQSKLHQKATKQARIQTRVSKMLNKGMSVLFLLMHAAPDGDNGKMLMQELRPDTMLLPVSYQRAMNNTEPMTYQFPRTLQERPKLDRVFATNMSRERGHMTGNPKISMWWNKSDFDREIGRPYGLDLIGWPTLDTLPFANCSKLLGGNKMFKDLMAKWETGELYFKQTWLPRNLVAVGALVQVPRHYKTRRDIKTTPNRILAQLPEKTSRKRIKAGPKSVPVIIESSDGSAGTGQKRSRGSESVWGRRQKKIRTTMKSAEVIENSDIESDKGESGSHSGAAVVDSDPIEDWSDY